jgi:hypothetical protein
MCLGRPMITKLNRSNTRPRSELRTSWHQAGVYFLEGRVRLSPLGTSITNRQFSQPRMMDDDECGAVGRMIGMGSRNTRWNSSTVLLCPLQITYDLTWVRTWEAAVSSRQLTTLDTARPKTMLITRSLQAVWTRYFIIKMKRSNADKINLQVTIMRLWYLCGKLLPATFLNYRRLSWYHAIWHRNTTAHAARCANRIGSWTENGVQTNEPQRELCH